MYNCRANYYFDNFRLPQNCPQMNHRQQSSLLPCSNNHSACSFLPCYHQQHWEGNSYFILFSFCLSFNQSFSGFLGWELKTYSYQGRHLSLSVENYLYIHLDLQLFCLIGALRDSGFVFAFGAPLFQSDRSSLAGFYLCMSFDSIDCCTRAAFSVRGYFPETFSSIHHITLESCACFHLLLFCDPLHLCRGCMHQSYLDRFDPQFQNSFSETFWTNQLRKHVSTYLSPACQRWHFWDWLNMTLKMEVAACTKFCSWDLRSFCRWRVLLKQSCDTLQRPDWKCLICDHKLASWWFQGSNTKAFLLIWI